MILRPPTATPTVTSCPTRRASDLPYLSARDAWRDTLLLQGVAEPVSSIASVGQHPLRVGQTVEQSGRASVVADRSGGQEEADWKTIRITHGMKLGVHAAFRPADQASWNPFFTRRPAAVRRAFRKVASISIVLSLGDCGFDSLSNTR